VSIDGKTGSHGKPEPIQHRVRRLMSTLQCDRVFSPARWIVGPLSVIARLDAGAPVPGAHMVAQSDDTDTGSRLKRGMTAEITLPRLFAFTG